MGAEVDPRRLCRRGAGARGGGSAALVARWPVWREALILCRPAGDLIIATVRQPWP